MQVMVSTTYGHFSKSLRCDILCDLCMIYHTHPTNRTTKTTGFLMIHFLCERGRYEGRCHVLTIWAILNNLHLDTFRCSLSREMHTYLQREHPNKLIENMQLDLQTNSRASIYPQSKTIAINMHCSCTKVDSSGANQLCIHIRKGINIVSTSCCIIPQDNITTIDHVW